jgi:hypothetical protein
VALRPRHHSLGKNDCRACVLIYPIAAFPQVFPAILAKNVVKLTRNVGFMGHPIPQNLFSVSQTLCGVKLALFLH